MGPQQLRALAQELPDCCDRRHHLTTGFRWSSHPGPARHDSDADRKVGLCNL